LRPVSSAHLQLACERAFFSYLFCPIRGVPDSSGYGDKWLS
jgi:hypothetical protein